MITQQLIQEYVFMLHSFSYKVDLQINDAVLYQQKMKKEYVIQIPLVNHYINDLYVCFVPNSNGAISLSIKFPIHIKSIKVCNQNINHRFSIEWH